MNKFIRILGFEFTSITAKKSWIIPTIIFVCLALAFGFFPQISNLFGADLFSGTSEPSIPTIGIAFDSDLVKQDEVLPFLPGRPKAYATRSELEQALLSEEVDQAYLIHSPDHYSTIMRDTSLYAGDNNRFSDVLQRVREKRFLGDSVDFEAFRQAMDVPIENTPVILGTDGQTNYGFTYGLIFVVYFLVIFYGTTVSTSVAREKSDRTMELLITSTNPAKLFYGKVFGAGLAGLLQFSLIVGAIFLGFTVNHKAWGFNILKFLDIPPRVWIIFLGFTLVGYLLYLFIYAMLGSTVSKVEDVSTASMPIMLLMVASFMVVNFSMGAPDSAIMVAASYIPFSSPIAMFARSALGSSVTNLEILISFAILFVTTITIAVVSTKLYRLGTLNYGNRLTLVQALKMLRLDRE